MLPNRALAKQEQAARLTRDGLSSVISAGDQF
jgi:hypothetical protein